MVSESGYSNNLKAIHKTKDEKVVNHSPDRNGNNMWLKCLAVAHQS